MSSSGSKRLMLYAVYQLRSAYQQDVRPQITATSDSNEMDVKVLYAFFWVIPRRMNFISRRFGTLSAASS